MEIIILQEEYPFQQIAQKKQENDQWNDISLTEKKSYIIILVIDNNSKRYNL